MFKEGRNSVEDEEYFWYSGNQSKAIL